MANIRTFFFDSSMRSMWYGQGDMPCAEADLAHFRLRAKTNAIVVVDGHKSARRPNLSGI